MATPLIPGTTTTSGSATSGTAIILWGPMALAGTGRLHAEVAANGAFRLDTQITPDGGTTWVTTNTTSGATGVDATYTSNAVVDKYMPTYSRLAFTTSASGTVSLAFDVRSFFAREG